MVETPVVEPECLVLGLLLGARCSVVPLPHQHKTRHCPRGRLRAEKDPRAARVRGPGQRPWLPEAAPWGCIAFLGRLVLGYSIHPGHWLGGWALLPPKSDATLPEPGLRAGRGPGDAEGSGPQA